MLSQLLDDLGQAKLTAHLAIMANRVRPLQMVIASCQAARVWINQDLQAGQPFREGGRESHHIHSASLAQEAESVFMSEPFSARQRRHADFWSLCHMKGVHVSCSPWNRLLDCALMSLSTLSGIHNQA